MRPARNNGSIRSLRISRICERRTSTRAGVNAIAALAWNAGSGVGAVISGAIRGAVGPGGYTVNLLTLVVFYTAAAALIQVFFRQHVPSGDVGAVVLPAPDSRA